MGSHPVILNGKGAAAVMVAAWASWVPVVSVVCTGDSTALLMPEDTAVFSTDPPMGLPSLPSHFTNVTICGSSAKHNY